MVGLEKGIERQRAGGNKMKIETALGGRDYITRRRSPDLRMMQEEKKMEVQTY